MFYVLQQLLKFLVVITKKYWIHEVSNIHVYQCPCTILLREFLGADEIVFVYCTLEKVVNSESD